jgi:ubiquinone/menaquinone biosynthesis C-methylase UbiE
VRSLEPVRDALDLGAGDGRLAPEIPAERVVLADTSALALARAARRLPGARTVELAPDERLPLGDSELDLVVCVRVVDHVHDVQLLLSEARRVLRPGGRLAVAVRAHGRLTGLAILARGFEREFDPLSPHVRFLTRRSLARVLDATGFDVESLRRERGDLLAVARR